MEKKFPIFPKKGEKKKSEKNKKGYCKAFRVTRKPKKGKRSLFKEDESIWIEFERIITILIRRSVRIILIY